VVETLGLCPLPKMHQSDQPPFDVAIPETPLRAVKLIQGMAANPTICERDNAKIRVKRT
jgi:hypothetical protein